MARLPILTVCVSFLTITCAAAERDKDVIVRKVFISSANHEIVMAAGEVSACRLSPLPKPTGLGLLNKPRRYEESEKVEVPAELAGRLRDELNDPETYRLRRGNPGNGGAGCITNYGVRIFFASESQSLEVNICLGCGDLGLSRNGKFFHEVRLKRKGDLVAICKLLFPEDEAIQRLKASD